MGFKKEPPLYFFLYNVYYVTNPSLFSFISFSIVASSISCIFSSSPISQPLHPTYAFFLTSMLAPQRFLYTLSHVLPLYSSLSTFKYRTFIFLPLVHSYHTLTPSVLISPMPHWFLFNWLVPMQIPLLLFLVFTELCLTTTALRFEILVNHFS